MSNFFTEDYNAVVEKVIGYYTVASGIVKTKPETKENLVAVKVLLDDGSEGAIPQVCVKKFEELPEQCD